METKVAARTVAASRQFQLASFLAISTTFLVIIGVKIDSRVMLRGSERENRKYEKKERRGSKILSIPLVP